MPSLFVRFNNTTQDAVASDIRQNGGAIDYISPILPILAYSGEEGIADVLRANHAIEYIVEAPEDGNLLEDGHLNSNMTPLQLVPKVDHTTLRQVGTGWGTTVAVLDAGISEEWAKEHFDFTGNGSSPVIDHGNKVGSIIKRYSRGSRIVSVKVAQYFNGVKAIDVLNGINFAVNTLQADIINLSVGFQRSACQGVSCPLCDHVNAYAQQGKVLFVTAAGNDGGEGTIDCPGKAFESVTVGAITQTSNEIAAYSSKGHEGQRKPNILSSGSIYFNGIYDEGTSYSTPVVTGVCASLFDKIKKPAELKDLIYSTAQDLHKPFHHQGFGLMNVDRILEVLADGESVTQSEGQG